MYTIIYYKALSDILDSWRFCSNIEVYCKDFGDIITFLSICFARNDLAACDYQSSSMNWTLDLQ